MTPSEKLEKIRRLQEDYLAKIDDIKTRYRREVGRIMGSVDKKKMAKVRAELGL